MIMAHTPARFPIAETLPSRPAAAAWGEPKGPRPAAPRPALERDIALPETSRQQQQRRRIDPTRDAQQRDHQRGEC